MGRQFLAGVATVDMYKGDQLIGTAKTLTDSSISTSVSGEEVRGGEGNQKLGMYYHTSAMEINLVDSMFKLDYIALQTGSTVELGCDVYQDEEVVLGEDGKGTIVGDPVAVENYGIIGWATYAGQEAYTRVVFTNKEFTLPGGQAGERVCVKYCVKNPAAEYITISANFIPDTVKLVMKATLFDGGGNQSSNSLESATKIGYILIEVPRFQFNGSQELSMTASGVATVPIAGSALANVATDCAGTSYYATIKKVINGAKWYDNITSIVIEDGDFNLAVSESKEIGIRAITKSGSSTKINNDQFNFTSTDSSIVTVSNLGVVGAVAIGTTQIVASIKDKPEIEASVNVTVNPS